MKLSTTISGLVALASSALGQGITQVNDFPGQPTRLRMYTYVPPNLKTPAPILVAVHHCQGSAQQYSQETHFQQSANQKGFIVIYPNSKSGGGCFDVASTATLTHNGGGDSQTIVNMVKYAVDKLGGDAKRVFVVGTSSGAMMTNVLCATYPDVFKAGSVYSGVPAGCFYVAGSTATSDPPGWANNCANGQLSKTAQAWGDQVRAMYPGWNGTYPRMQIWHGTADSTLAYPNYAETMKEWSNVMGLSSPQTAANTPQQGYTRTIYGEGDAKTAQLVGYSAQGVGHTVPQHDSMDLDFFGL